MESVHFLLSDLSDNLECQIEFDNTGQDVLDQDDMDYFCALAKTLTEPSAFGHMFSFTFQILS